jgi:hypothetical protein
MLELYHGTTSVRSVQRVIDTFELEIMPKDLDYKSGQPSGTRE